MITDTFDKLVSEIVDAWDKYAAWHYSNFWRINLLFLVLCVVIIMASKVA